MKSIKNLISLGYLLMALLVIGIMYIWYKEWCDLEKLEVQNRHIEYLQPIITQYFIDNKSEIWLLFLIAHSKR